MVAIPESHTRPILHVEDTPLGGEHGWRPAEGFACRRCGSPALIHPETDLIWGCKNCDLTTNNPRVFFRKDR